MGNGSQMNGGTVNRLVDKLTGLRLNLDRWQVMGHG